MEKSPEVYPGPGRSAPPRTHLSSGYPATHGRRRRPGGGGSFRRKIGVEPQPRHRARRDPIHRDMPATAQVDPPASFESALEELESLVQRMESGELTLEDSLLAYRRGAQLVGFCRDSLARVQQQVKVLEGDLLRPFDADGRGEG